MVRRDALLFVLGVVTAAVVTALLLPPQFSTHGDAGLAVLEAELATMREDLRSLRAQVQTVQANQERGEAPAGGHPGGGDDRREAVTPVDHGTLLTELAGRVAELERAIAQVRSAQQSLGPMPDSVTGIVAALADKNLHGHDASPAQKQRRMELRRRLLELAPDDPQAPQVLLELSTDALFAGGPARALAVLDEFTPRVSLSTWDRLRTYASLHSQNGDGDRARTLYDAAIRDPSLAVEQRTEARFWRAYSLFEQGRLAEAAAGFQALVDEFGSDPPAGVRSTIDGARTYLAKCRSR